MLALVTGQVGMDKKPYLESVARFANEQGESTTVFNVGDMMYAEARDVRPGRILDLPLSRLNSLRRAAFKDIIAQARDSRHAIVNTHATFRWRHGLFSAFDFDQIQCVEARYFHLPARQHRGGARAARARARDRRDAEGLHGLA